MALPSQNRLRKKKDFDAVFKEGHALRGNSLFIKYRKNLMPVSRFGFIIPLKAVGNVATRNRIKRVLSEAIRIRLMEVLAKNGSASGEKKGQDIVVTVRKKEKEDVLKNEMLKLLGV